MKRPYKRRRLFLAACIRDCFINIYRFFCFSKQTTADTHHNDPLMPRHAKDSIVAGRSACCRIDEQKNVAVNGRKGSDHIEHEIQMRSSKKLLSRIKTQPSQLALNQVGSILHHIPQSRMTCSRLPPARSTPHQSDTTDKYFQYHMLFDMEIEDT